MEERVLNGDIILLNGLGRSDEERRIVCHCGRYFSLDEKSGHTLALDKDGKGFSNPTGLVEAYEHLGYKVSLKKGKKKSPVVTSGSIEVKVSTEETVKNGDVLIINGPHLANAERKITCMKGRYFVIEEDKNIVMDVSNNISSSEMGGCETPQKIVEAYKGMGMDVELKKTKKKKGVITQGQMNIIELGNCEPSGIISDDGYNAATQLTGYIGPSSVAKEAVPMITAKHAKILKEKLEKYGANGVDELQVYAQLVKIVDFYERQSFFKMPEKTPIMYFGQDWNKGQDATMTAIQNTVNGDQEEPKPETAITPNLSATEKAAMDKFKEATEVKLIEDIAKLIATINHVYTPFENVNAPTWHGMRKDQKEYLHRLVRNYMKDGISFQKSYERDVDEAGNPLGAPYQKLPKDKRVMDAIGQAICDFFK